MMHINEDKVSRRERKKQATRQQIKAVAVQLFNDHGFDNVTIVQIANAADVDVTTFWRHFGSKLAILYADQEAWIEAFHTTLESIPQDRSPIDAAIEALVRTPPVGAPELAEIRAELSGNVPSPEVRSAILAVEDLARRELAVALAKRMNIDATQDPRPAVLGGAILAAAAWFRDQMMLQPGYDVMSGPTDLARIVRQGLAAST
jgi:AcrR family transcriptional regulator